MDKMRLAVHFGSRESWYYVLLLLSSLSARLAPPLRPFAFRAPPGLCLLLLALLPHLQLPSSPVCPVSPLCPFAFCSLPVFAFFFCPASSFLLCTPSPRCSSAPMIKRGDFSVGLLKLTFLRPGEMLKNFLTFGKNPQKSGVFLSSVNLFVRKVARAQHSNKAILGCA